MKITLMPDGEEIEVNPAKSLLQLCNDNKIPIKSICKGVPSCTECRVNIISGEQNILPPNKDELALIGSSYFLDQRRLACQIYCFGPVKIDIHEHKNLGDLKTRKIKGIRIPTASSKDHDFKVSTTTLVMEKGVEPEKHKETNRENNRDNNRNPNSRGNSRNRR